MVSSIHDVWSLTNIGSDIVERINARPSEMGLAELGLDEQLYNRVIAHIRNSNNVLEAMRSWKPSHSVLQARAEYITFIVVIEGILEDVDLRGLPVDPDPADSPPGVQ